jgi:hypothetical protein
MLSHTSNHDAIQSIIAILVHKKEGGGGEGGGSPGKEKPLQHLPRPEVRLEGVLYQGHMTYLVMSSSTTHAGGAIFL